jgi:hypothetical protein
VLPLYDQVKAEHVVPGVRQLLKELNAEIDRLEGSVEPTWEGLVQPLEALTDRHSRTWGVVSHLKVTPCLCSGRHPKQQLESSSGRRSAWAAGHACSSTYGSSSLLWSHARMLVATLPPNPHCRSLEPWEHSDSSPGSRGHQVVLLDNQLSRPASSHAVMQLKRWVPCSAGGLLLGTVVGALALLHTSYRLQQVPS